MKRISIAFLLVFGVLAALVHWAHPQTSMLDSEAKASNEDVMAKKWQVPAPGPNQPPTKMNGSYSRPDISNSATPSSIEELRQKAADIADCIRLQNHKRIADSLLGQPSYAVNDYARTRLDQNLEMAGAQINKLESEGACVGLDAASLTGEIYPLLLEMARRGDAEAADCYVAADFELSNDQVKPAQVEAYRTNAGALIAEQLEKGDWRMVELMEAANDRDGDPHRGRYTWFREISAGNPLLAYRYNRLLRFGATDDYGAKLDRALQARKAEINPTQIAEQDEWAENEYEAHFTHSPPVDAYIPTCKLYSDVRVFHNILR